MQKTFLFIILVLGGAVLFSTPAQATTLVNADITSNTTWSAAGSPYVLTKRIIIPTNTTLTVEQGVVVKVATDIVVSGTLRTEGTVEAPIIFTSRQDDIAGDTNNDGSITSPASGQWITLSAGLVGKLYLKYTEFRYGGGDSLNLRGTLTSIKGPITLDHVYLHDSKGPLVNMFGAGGVFIADDSRFEDTSEGIVTNGGSTMTLRNNVFKNIAGWAIYNSYVSSLQKQVDAASNYWGSNLGPEKMTRTRPDSALVSNNVITDPFLTTSPFCEVDCFSNVLFLPGIKASRLYKQGPLTENQLWEPTLFDADLSDLAMDASGSSIQNGIYTRDVVDEAGGIGGNIYKSIMSDFSRLKTSGAINDYSLFAYDWRYDVRDIVNGGTAYQAENKNLVAEVARLAGSAKSKKVTIVAHSNGGLLAKALMQKLEATGQSGQVDKIILIGTPQMGTPLATLSFLYGYDEQLLYGTLVSRKDARQFTENLPGAYALLPSQEYFARGGESIIQFDQTSTRYEDYRAEYGDKIQSWADFVNFLTGADGRSKPAVSDMEKENILNSTLLSKTQNTHDALDAWVPPAGVQVVQIAGTGLDTVVGVKYTEKEKATCVRIHGITVCRPNGQYEPIYEPVFSKDGDKVVAAPSALMLSAGGNVERYWVDIKKHNDDNIDRKHASLTEMTPVRTFVESLLRNQGTVLPDFIATTSPNQDDRLRMRLYSPLDIHLYDTHGNHTGPRSVTIGGVTRDIIEENIPNSYYYQLGERKYVGVPKGEEIRTELRGYAEGSYTLEVDEVVNTPTGEEIVQNITFKNLPTTAETIADLTLTEAGIAALPALTADTNGDGTEDYSLSPIIGEEVTLEEPQDQTPPETTITVTGTEGVSSWYRSQVAVTLSTEEAAITEYSLNNTTWQSYTTPFTVAAEGKTIIQYHSTDTAGNLEQTKTKKVKIDTKAPEAKIGFDTTQDKLVVGSEESNIVVSQTDNIYTLVDEAGNITMLTFVKNKEKKYKNEYTLGSIQYNAQPKINFTSARLQYFYKEEKNKEKAEVFSAQLKINNDKVTAHYVKKKNQTFIMDKTEQDEADGETADKRKTREILQGWVIPYLVTKEGEIKIKY